MNTSIKSFGGSAGLNAIISSKGEKEKFRLNDIAMRIPGQVGDALDIRSRIGGSGYRRVRLPPDPKSRTFY